MRRLNETVSRAKSQIEAAKNFHEVMVVMRCGLSAVWRFETKGTTKKGLQKIAAAGQSIVNTANTRLEVLYKNRKRDLDSLRAAYEKYAETGAYD